MSPRREQKKLCQQEMKFKVKLAESCRAPSGVVQTGRKAGDEEGGCGSPGLGGGGCLLHPL